MLHCVLWVQQQHSMYECSRENFEEEQMISSDQVEISLPL